MILSENEKKILTYLNDPSSVGKIHTDYTIYRIPSANDQTNYKINVNNPVANKLYCIYKKNNNLPLHYPCSDLDRFAFERWIFKLIRDKKIILHSNAKKE